MMAIGRRNKSIGLKKLWEIGFETPPTLGASFWHTLRYAPKALGANNSQIIVITIFSWSLRESGIIIESLSYQSTSLVLLFCNTNWPCTSPLLHHHPTIFRLSLTPFPPVPFMLYSVSCVGYFHYFRLRRNLYLAFRS
jgi:hypothetical protein